MSFTAMAWASKQKVKSASQKLVLLMLANYADDENKCWPSKQTLAKVCCMSKSAVCSAILALGEMGLLEVEERGGTSSIIKLQTGCPPEGQGCPANGQGVSVKRTGGVLQEDTNLLLKQSNKPIKETATDFFEEFWQAYPHRPGDPKKKALQSYNKAIKAGATHEDIMAGLKAYSRTMAGSDPVYLAMASTWLNQERWKSDYGSPIDQNKLNEFCVAYPSQNIGSKTLVENAYATALRSATHEQIMEGIKKFALLAKQYRSDNRPMPIMAAADWLKFRKWQDMENYEVGYRGMSSEKYLKLKKGVKDVA